MKILIADDQPLDRSVLRLSLEKWGYDIVEAKDGTEAMRILEGDDGPSIAVLDWMMPGLSGPDICREIRRQDRPLYTYIILLTSKEGKDDLVEGMKSGADDYVVKPVNMHELQVRIRAGKRIIDLQEELIATREELRVQATRDFLTGAWNRRVIMEKLTEEIHRAGRRGDTLGVIMCDIDHFKAINDTHGHPAGDTVLIEVSRRMESSVRSYDSLGRFGGEAFLIVIPDSQPEGIAVIAERIRASIAASSIETASESIQVTVSLGTTAQFVDRMTSPEDLILQADRALYRAKNEGRNRVESADLVLKS